MGMKAYVYAEVNADITNTRYNDTAGKKEVFIAFDKKNETVDFKYGISFISIEKVKSNLAKEMPGWNFEQVVGNAQSAWQKVMSQINVIGGTTAQKGFFIPHFTVVTSVWLM